MQAGVHIGNRAQMQAMLCYARLCHAMPCYVMLSYAIACRCMLCYAMLCYAILCYINRYSTPERPIQRWNLDPTGRDFLQLAFRHASPTRERPIQRRNDRFNAESQIQR